MQRQSLTPENHSGTTRRIDTDNPHVLDGGTGSDAGPDAQDRLTPGAVVFEWVDENGSDAIEDFYADQEATA